MFKLRRNVVHKALFWLSNVRYWDYYDGAFNYFSFLRGVETTLLDFSLGGVDKIPERRWWH
jgi:hypothetical protein